MTTVTLGIGGVLHDFTAAVCHDGRLTAIAVGADVVGLPHAVDVAAMQRTFEQPPAEKAVGRWLLAVRRSGAVEATVRAALDAAGVSPEDLAAVGYTCPDLLVPAGLPAQRWKANQLDAHAAGVIEAARGDVALVLDGTGDRGVDGAYETAAAYLFGAALRRYWTAHEPASLGVLLDTAGLVAGLPALDRDAAAESAFGAAPPAAAAGPLKASTTEDGYELDGLAWRQMVRPDERDRYLAERGFDPPGFAQAALAAAVAVTRDLIERHRGPGRRVWLAGDAVLHPPFARAVEDLGAHPTRWPGDEGTAIGAARLAYASTRAASANRNAANSPGGIPWQL